MSRILTRGVTSPTTPSFATVFAFRGTAVAANSQFGVTGAPQHESYTERSLARVATNVDCPTGFPLYRLYLLHRCVAPRLELDDPLRETDLPAPA